jgi:rhodanese-related sulfurtransferase
MTDITHDFRPQDVRRALLAREEIALIDLREEADFARAHPLFAAQIPLRRLELEAAWRLPRRDVPVVVYDNDEGLVGPALETLRALGFTRAGALVGGLKGWRDAGYELFEDVNSYSKAFGELVEHRRHTPSLPAPDVQALIDEKADIAILDARRFEEYATMSIPGGVSTPGAELVLRARAVAPDPDTTIIVNCAGRTRSIIGTQSLINAGLPNRIYALRNGTIGWTLAGQSLETGQQRRAPRPEADLTEEARTKAREVAYRAGVKRITAQELAHLRADTTRTLYQYDVRLPEDYAAGHLPGFRNAQGGQLVQETDHFAPVRSARIVLSDDLGPRADMSASWLAQLGWEIYVLDGGLPGALETGPDGAPPPRGPEGRYKRPYEGTDNAQVAMQAYLDWEYGLVAQLESDGTHGFFVI